MFFYLWLVEPKVSGTFECDEGSGRADDWVDVRLRIYDMGIRGGTGGEGAGRCF